MSTIFICPLIGVSGSAKTQKGDCSHLPYPVAEIRGQKTMIYQGDLMHNYSYRFDDIQLILNGLPHAAERIYNNLSCIKNYFTYQTPPYTKIELVKHVHVCKTLVYEMIPILIKHVLITEIKIDKKYSYYLQLEHKLRLQNTSEVDGVLMNRERITQLLKEQSLHKSNGHAKNDITHTRQILEELKGDDCV